MNPRHVTIAACAIALACVASRATAQETDSAQEMAKKLANPVADMVSIPFQYNWENGVGPDEDLRTILNIQPVVPIPISESWNLIGRWIAPYVSQPASLGGASGLGDIVFSGFLSPVGSSGFTWGAGPVFSLPMTTDPALGTGKWSAGPTTVGLKIDGPWIYGMLFNHLWSFANTSNLDRADVNQSFFQPFLAYATAGGVTFTLQSESSANWNAANDDDTWTVPINLQVSKITKLGPFPMSVVGGAGAYVAKPEGGADWKIRTAFVLILPRGK